MAHTKKFRERFIREFQRTGTIIGASKAMGIDRRLHYDWMRDNAWYKKAFGEAAEPIVGMIEDEVLERAVNGWLEPVFSGGKQATMYAVDVDGKPLVDKEGKPVMIPAVVLKKSDAMLAILAQARVPGYSQKLDHRLVDKEGDDREVNITVEYIRAPRPE